SFAVVVILAGAGFGVFGTKIALQSAPPALPERPEPAAPDSKSTARGGAANTPSNAPASTSSSPARKVPALPMPNTPLPGSLEALKQIAATADRTHPAPTKPASKQKKTGP